MSAERIMMMGKLAEAQQQRKRLLLKAEGLCSSIRQDISPVLSNVEDMDIPRASLMMDELMMAYVDILGLNNKIERLNRELGNGQ